MAPSNTVMRCFMLRSFPTLFTALALSLGLLPAAASAAVVEILSVNVTKGMEADGDEVRMSLSIDFRPAKTFAEATVVQGRGPWNLNRTVAYKSQVYVTMHE